MKEKNKILYQNNDKDILTLAITGECMATRPFSMYNEDEFLEMIGILREADVAFTHFEMLIHNFNSYPGKADFYGGYFGAEPIIAEEIKWAGINIVSCAHNHCKDYGNTGLFSTINNLNRLGIINSGMGSDLEEAREPAYLDTNKGRVALISVSSGHQPHERASYAKGSTRGRPGCNYLRFSTKYVIDSSLLMALNEIGSKLGFRTREHLAEGEVYFLGRIFAPGEKYSINTFTHKGDLEGNIRSIKDAKRQADLVLVSHHYHAPTINRDIPPTFVEQFAKDCIDAGADVYIGTGPHRILGIEIYKDKPILYSIGNFFAQSQFLKRVPPESFEFFFERAGIDYNSDQLLKLTPADYHDARIGILPLPGPQWWSSILTQLNIIKGRLTEIKIYPLTLGREGEKGEIVSRQTGTRTEGRPLLAKGDTNKRILNRLMKLSAIYSTYIEFINDVGIIRLQ